MVHQHAPGDRSIALRPIPIDDEHSRKNSLYSSEGGGWTDWSSGAEEDADIAEEWDMEAELELKSSPRLANGVLLGDRYQIVDRIDIGASATVYRAIDTRLHRVVAVKVLHQELRGRLEVLSRFLSEANRMAVIDSEYVVPIYDVQPAGPYVYQVMKLVSGESLQARLDGGNRPGLRESLSIASQVLLALQEIHSQGLLHRDVKPANIMVTPEGRVLLLDLGISRDTRARSVAITDEHALLGTPLYMAPESVLQLPLDVRSDLYSVGVVLYELLTGQPPFNGRTTIEVYLHHVNTHPVSACVHHPEISPALDALLLQSLAKEPRDRFESARAMYVRLQQILSTYSDGPAEGRTVPDSAVCQEVDSDALEARAAQAPSMASSTNLRKPLKTGGGHPLGLAETLPFPVPSMHRVPSLRMFAALTALSMFLLSVALPSFFMGLLPAHVWALHPLAAGTGAERPTVTLDDERPQSTALALPADLTQQDIDSAHVSRCPSP